MSKERYRELLPSNFIQSANCMKEKLIKYIIIFLIIIICLRYIPEHSTLKLVDIIIISLISVLGYCILDIISPSVTIYNES